jgi:hypothetical protein
MAVAWRLIRVSAELHAELVALARHFDRMQTVGKMNVPSCFADPRGGHVGTPLWYVIQRILAEWREKKRRSRSKHPAGRSNTRPTPQSPVLAAACKHRIEGDLP